MSSFEPPVAGLTETGPNPPGSGGPLLVSPLQAIYIEQLLRQAYPRSAVQNIYRYFIDTWDHEKEVSSMPMGIGGEIIGALKSGNASKIKVIDSKLKSPRSAKSRGF